MENTNTKNNRDVGNIGEAIAVSFLEKNGFEIVTTNFRNRLGEIDIISTKNNKRGEVVYHFVEVKYRLTNKYGLGREAVTAQKQKTIHRVATAFLLARDLYNRVDLSFDVVEIMGTVNDHQIEFFESCF